MFRPNVRCVVTRLEAKYTLYGEQKEERSWPAKCGVVKLRLIDQQTTVRADSSASRGFAEEDAVEARLMFLPAADVAEGDVIEVAGRKVKVTIIHPRFSITGALSHKEVDCTAWQSK